MSDGTTGSDETIPLLDDDSVDWHDPAQTLTNADHAQLAAWADAICEHRRGRLPTCPFCVLAAAFWDGGETLGVAYANAPTMEFRHGNIHRDPIAWGQNRKCPECYFLIGFGIPMTEPEYDHTKWLQGGSRHYNGKPAEDVDAGEVQEQLAALGYLEM